MGMLDAVVYNLVNQIKTLSTTINTKMDMLVGGWNNQLTELRLGLTDTRIGFLDYLYNLENRLTTAWANQLTSLRTDYTSARAGYLDLVNTINSRLTDVWSAQLTSLRSDVTSARAGYLDLINAMNTRLSNTWAAKLDSIRTAYTDTRAANLDAIPEARLVKLDQLRTNLTDQRSANLDLIPGIISGLGRAPKLRVRKPYSGSHFSTTVQAYSNTGFSNSTVVYGTNNTTTTTTALNIVGSGKFRQLYANLRVTTGTVAATASMTINVYVDGYLYFTANRIRTAGWTANTSHADRVLCIGEVVATYNGSTLIENVIPEEVIFNSSFKVDVVINNTGSTFQNSFAMLYYEYETN